MASLHRILLMLSTAGLVMSHPNGYGGATSSSYASASSSANSYGGGTGGGGGGGGYPPYGGGGGPPYGAGYGMGGGGYGPPNFGQQTFNPNFQDPFQFHKYLQSYLNYMHEMVKQASQASANSIPGCASSDLGDRFGPPAGAGGYPSGGGGSYPSGGGGYPSGGAGAGSGSTGGGAIAVGSIGPGGGYGSTKVFPQDSGLGDRFGPSTGVKESSGPIPAPSGGSYGVSSFSSSSSSDVNGQKTSQKSATVSVNDNGKVTTYTSHDP